MILIGKEEDSMSSKRVKSFSTKKLFSQVLTLAMVVATVYLVSGSVEEWVTNYKYKQELVELQNELETLSTEKVELEGLKEKLSNSDYVQNYARGKHLMSKSDEQVFILPKPKE